MSKNNGRVGRGLELRPKRSIGFGFLQGW